MSSDHSEVESTSQDIEPLSSPLRDASSPLDVSFQTTTTPESSPVKYSGSSPLSSPKSDPVAPNKRRCYAFSYEAPEYKAAYWPAATTTSGASGESSSGNVGGINDEFDNQPERDTEPAEFAPFPINEDVHLPRDEAASSSPLPSDTNIVSDNEISCDSSSVTSNEEEAVVISDVECSDRQLELSSSSSDSGGDGDCDDIRAGDLKVYEGCNISVDEGVCALMDLFMTQKLSKTTLEYVLRIILKFLPEENHMPQSKHLLFKYVHDASPAVPYKVHFYCDNCLFYIGEEEKACPVCGSNVCNKFYQLSLAAQIKSLFEMQNLAQIIDKYQDVRMQRQALGKYFDICDGSEFKRVQTHAGNHNLTLLGHTDGISISNSSNVSLWPLEYAICEVPPKLRYRLLLIAGVWVARSKPNMHCYLEPFASEMQDLYNNGVTWINPLTKANEKSFVVAPFFCGDAPVRANLQNILEIAGKHSCNNCEAKTVKLPSEALLPGVKKIKRKRVFYPKENPSPLRTAQRMEAQGQACLQILEETGKLVPQKGVKGKSILCKFPECDPSTAVFPEYMHSLMGIVKMLDLIFESSLECNLKKYRNDINDFLGEVREPDFVTRCPKSTTKFSEWKANECRSFLLYLSLPVFSRCMSRDYLQHWMLLVEAEYLLLQECVTEKDIEKSEILVKMFLRQFSQLYTQKSLTYNLHNLSHSGLTVRRVGPLWSNSTFPWEDYNGSLQERIHGTKNQGIELVRTIQLYQSLQVLKARAESSTASRVQQQENVTFRDAINGHRFTNEEKLIFVSSNLTPKSVFYRAVYVSRGGEVFTSAVYTRQKIKNNFTICFSEVSGLKRYGEISFFVECSDGKQVALVKCFAIEHQRMFCHYSGFVVKHLIPFKESSELQIVPMNRILSKVVRVNSFVCIRPNQHEVNL